MDFYEVLGVSQKASFEEIKRAYTRLCKTLHPDKFRAYGREKYQEALSRFTLINEAFATLSDPLKRENYDKELANGNVYSPYEKVRKSQSISLFKMGKNELEQGNYAKASQYFKAALRLFPKEYLARSYLALSYLKGGRNQEEIMELVQKIYEEKDSVKDIDTLYTTARVFMAIGKKEEALTLLEMAIKISPSNMKVKKFYEEVKKEVKKGFLNFFKFK